MNLVNIWQIGRLIPREKSRVISVFTALTLPLDRVVTRLVFEFEVHGFEIGIQLMSWPSVENRRGRTD